VGSDARKGITSDQLGAWILSECIHRLDYPCLADLKEPILYYLGKVVAFTLDEVESYIGRKYGMRDIEEEKKYIGQLNAARMKLAMIKNIIVRQEEVWNTFSSKLSTEVWRNGSNKETRAKIESVTYRPVEDFARLKLWIQRIDDDAERVERLMLVELDLKSKHAGLTEAHRSTILSRTVIGLTVTTIIYAPLSLMIGLFALPIDQLKADQNNGTYTKDYIVRWMGKTLPSNDSSTGCRS
jgi:hypothetical protein